MTVKSTRDRETDLLRNRVHLTKPPHDSGLYRESTVSVGVEREKKKINAVTQ